MSETSGGSERKPNVFQVVFSWFKPQVGEVDSNSGASLVEHRVAVGNQLRKDATNTTFNSSQPIVTELVRNDPRNEDSRFDPRYDTMGARSGGERAVIARGKNKLKP